MWPFSSIATRTSLRLGFTKKGLTGLEAKGFHSTLPSLDGSLWLCHLSVGGTMVEACRGTGAIIISVSKEPHRVRLTGDKPGDSSRKGRWLGKPVWAHAEEEQAQLVFSAVLNCSSVCVY